MNETEGANEDAQIIKPENVQIQIAVNLLSVTAIFECTYLVIIVSKFGQTNYMRRIILMSSFEGQRNDVSGCICHANETNPSKMQPSAKRYTLYLAKLR